MLELIGDPNDGGENWKD